MYCLARKITRLISTSLLFSLTLSMTLLAQQISGHALTKEKLLALKEAGLSDAALIQQINNDGIGFEMTADTTLELKKAGVSNDVLQTLLQASSRTSISARSTADNPFLALYAGGRFPELADRLRSQLNTKPSDYRSRAFLIMVLLKMKEADAAKTEFRHLRDQTNDPEAKPYADQIETLFASIAKTEEAKTKVLAALKEYRSADAIAAIDSLGASSIQKDMLKMNLDVYEGEYNKARARFSKMQFGSYAQRERTSKILEHISEAEANYQALMSHIETYLYSPLAPSYCYVGGTQQYWSSQFLALSVQDYIDSVSKLSQVSPLNVDVMNLRFHAQLLTGKYDELEQLGDRLLKTNGRITIPFFSADRFFRLVIDSQKKHIYTEPDPRPFKVKYHSQGGMSTWGQEMTINEWWSELIPFDLSFEEIKGLSQKARRRRGDAELIVSKSYALKFEPSGLAPNYAMMNILYCTAGEKAEMTVTRNLGQYILHVTQNHAIKAELADPNTAAGPSSGWSTGLLALGALGGQTPMQTMAVQAIQADEARQAAMYQSQQAVWDSITARDAFGFIEAEAFTGLEQLIGVL
jgi:hypothetical protein